MPTELGTKQIREFLLGAIEKGAIDGLIDSVSRELEKLVDLSVAEQVAAYEASPSPLDMAFAALDEACEDPQHAYEIAHLSGVNCPYLVKVWLIDADGSPLIDGFVFHRSAETMLKAVQTGLTLIAEAKGRG